MRNTTKVGAQKNSERGLFETQVHPANTIVAAIILIGLIVAIGTTFIPKGFFHTSSRVSVNRTPVSNSVKSQVKPTESKVPSFPFKCPSNWSCKQEGLGYLLEDLSGKKIRMVSGVYDLSGFGNLDWIERQKFIDKGGSFAFKMGDKLALWLDLIPDVNAEIVLPSTGEFYNVKSTDLIINQGIIEQLFGAKITVLTDEQWVNTTQVSGSVPGEVDHSCIGEVRLLDSANGKSDRYCIGENIFRLTSYSSDIKSLEIYRKFVSGQFNFARIVAVNELRSEKHSSNDMSLVLIGSMATDHSALGGFNGAQIGISRRWPELVRELSIPEYTVSWNLFGAHWNPSVSKAIVNPPCIEGCPEYQFEGYDLLKNQTLHLKLPDFVNNLYSGDREAVVNYVLKNVRWLSDDEAEAEFVDGDSGKTLGTGKISFIDNVETIVNSVELPGPVKGKVVHICLNGEVKMMTGNSGAKYCIGENIFRLEDTNLELGDREIYRSYVQPKPTTQDFSEEWADRIIKVERLTSLKPSSHDVDMVLIGGFDEMGGFGGKRFELKLPNVFQEILFFGGYSEDQYLWNPSVTKAMVNYVAKFQNPRQEIYGYDLKRDRRLEIKLPDFFKTEDGTAGVSHVIYKLRVLRWIDDNTAELEFTDSNGKIQKGEVSFVTK